MDTQWLASNAESAPVSDPVISTLEDLLRAEEAAMPASRFAEALRAAMQVRTENSGSGSTEVRAPIAPYRLRRAQQYLEDNISSEIRLENVASAAGLSPYHFCRQFKQATGVSPLRYVLEMRIARAKRLILDTDTSLVDVSFSLGFSSQSHFTVIFRKLTGLTPRRYRELCRQ
jgi:transcriptional regulator GlxA family with amidase domain